MSSDETSIEYVTRSDRDGVATIELNRPERRNAIIGPLLDRLADHFEAVAADPSVHAVVLAGAGGAFCSGLDLDAYNADPPPEWLPTSRDSLLRAHLAIANCAAPVVVALERYAINGGAAFALAGDLVVVGRESWLQVGEVRIGMVAPMNLAWLTARYPTSTVLRVVLRGDRLTGEQLAHLGIADEVVDDEMVRPRASELATELAGFPGGAARTMKQTVLGLDGDPGRIESHFRRALESSPGGARPSRMT